MWWLPQNKNILDLLLICCGSEDVSRICCSSLNVTQDAFVHTQCKNTVSTCIPDLLWMWPPWEMWISSMLWSRHGVQKGASFNTLSYLISAVINATRRSSLQMKRLKCLQNQNHTFSCREEKHISIPARADDTFSLKSYMHVFHLYTFLIVVIRGFYAYLFIKCKSNCCPEGKGISCLIITFLHRDNLVHFWLRFSRIP